MKQIRSQTYSGYAAQTLLKHLYLFAGFCLFGQALGNELPFGLSAETNPDAASAILGGKPNIVVKSTSPEKVIFFVTRFSLNGVEFEAGSINYYKGRILNVRIEGKDISGVDDAYAALKNLRELLSENGRPPSTDRLGALKTGKDLMSGDIVLAFEGAPCYLTVSTMYNKSTSKFWPLIVYTNMAVLNEKTAASDAIKKQETRRTLELLR